MLYREMVESFLESYEKTITEDDFWIHVDFGYAIPRAGWKLHISGTSFNAPIIIAVAIPVARNLGCSFKITRSSKEIDTLNGRKSPQEQTGKFMTFYPRDETQAAELAATLDSVTLGLVSPRIPTDKQLFPNSIVYYRFGAFTSSMRVNRDGHMVMLYDQQGESHEDKRNPYYEEPNGLENPFLNLERRTVRLLGDYYQPRSAFKQSPRGGVYLVIDPHSKEFVIKEARAWTSGHSSDHEARHLLAVEYLSQLRLSGIRGVPAVHGFFLQEGNAYMVQDFVKGERLGDYIYDKFKRDEPVNADSIISALQGTVSEVHRKGVIHGDISNSNVLVDSDGNPHLIDFEQAIIQGAEMCATGLYTPGFSSRAVMNGSLPTTEDDQFSVDQVAFFLQTGLVVSNSDLDQYFSGDVLQSIKQSFPHYHMCIPLPVDQLNQHFVNKTRDWVCQLTHCRFRFDTGYGAPFSLHDGYAGVISVLCLLKPYDSGVTDKTIREYTSRLMASVDSIPSEAFGLHFGTLGAALAMLLAGRSLNDELIWNYGISLYTSSYVQLTSRQDPQDCDWTHGLAGLGYVSLLLCQWTGLVEYKRHVEYIVQLLQNNQLSQNGLTLWPCFLDTKIKHYLGFAHGVSGIGYFLAQAYRLLGISDARFLSLQCYETIIKTEVRGRWPHTPNDSEFWAAWCHGSPGVIHFLIAMKEITENASLEVAKRATDGLLKLHGFEPSGRCHGTVSLVDAFHHMYLATGDDQYREFALDALISINMRQQDTEQGLRWLDDVGRSDNPSLMTGGTGVAHAIAQVLLGVPNPLLLLEQCQPLVLQGEKG